MFHQPVFMNIANTVYTMLYDYKHVNQLCIFRKHFFHCITKQKQSMFYAIFIPLILL